MALLIKNAHVFAPKDLGVQDVLMAAEKVIAIGKDLPSTLPDTEVIDAKGQIMTPGFFDQHIHVTGGGGEGGPVTRTPEIMLSELVACGTTSVGASTQIRRRFSLDVYVQLQVSAHNNVRICFSRHVPCAGVLGGENCLGRPPLLFPDRSGSFSSFS